MPRYFAHDTQVRLAIWDPTQSLDSVQMSEPRPKGGIKAIIDENRRKKLRRPHTSGPGLGFACQELEETEFPQCENLRSIGGSNSFRFFLRIAGSELFYTKPPSVSTSSAHTVILKSTPDRHPLSSNDEIASTLEIAPLSSWAEPAQSNSRSRGIENPITSPKPLQLFVDLSKETFRKTLFDDNTQDLCINVFFNGEFTQSRVIKAIKLTGDSFNTSGLIERYSGRRADTSLEKPWIVLPCNQTKDGFVRVSRSSEISLENRWEKVAELLLRESNKWGEYNSTISPMGGYLKALSELTLPTSANTMRNGTPHRVGIIDVVLVLGTTVSASVSGLRSPQRKIHENLCGLDRKHVVVPEPPRRRRPSSCLDSSKLSVTTISGEDNGAPRRVRSSLMRSQTMVHIAAAPPTQQEFGKTGVMVSNKPSIFESPLGHLASVERTERSLSQSTAASRIGSTLADSYNYNRGLDQPAEMPSVPSGVREQHPKMPKNLPRKTYKGVDNVETAAYNTRSKSGSSISHEKQQDIISHRSISAMTGNPLSIGDNLSKPAPRGQLQSVGAHIISLEGLAGEGSMRKASDSNAKQMTPRTNTFVRTSSSDSPPSVSVNSRSQVRFPVAGKNTPQDATQLGPEISHGDTSNLIESPLSMVLQSMTPLRAWPRNNTSDIFTEAHCEENRNQFRTSDMIPDTGDLSTSQNLLLLKTEDISEHPVQKGSETGIIEFKTLFNSYTDLVDRNVLAIATMEYSDLSVVRTAVLLPQPSSKVDFSDASMTMGSTSESSRLPTSSQDLEIHHQDKRAWSRTHLADDDVRGEGLQGAGRANSSQPKRQRSRGSMLSKELKGLMQPHDRRKAVDESLSVASSEGSRSRNSSAGPARQTTPILRSLPEIKRLPRSQSRTKDRRGGSMGDVNIRRPDFNGLTVMQEDESAILASQPSDFPEPLRITKRKILETNQPENMSLGRTLPETTSQGRCKRIYNQTVEGLRVPGTKKDSAAAPATKEGSSSSLSTRLFRPKSTPVSSSGPSEKPHKPRGKISTPITNNSKIPVDNISVAASQSATSTANTKSTSRTSTPKHVTPDQSQLSSTSKSSTSKPRPLYMSLESRQWKPNTLNDDSVITYAETALWDDVSIDPASGVALRATRQEREGVFRGSEILFGTRFVVGL